MTGSASAPEHAEPPVIESEEDYGLSDELIHAIEDALETGHGDRVLALTTELHEADLAGHRDAPPGLRVWGGATVAGADIEALLPWLDWAFDELHETRAEV